MGEFELHEGSDITDHTVEETDRIEGLTFATLVREGTVTIPGGQTALGAGNRVVVIGGRTPSRRSPTRPRDRASPGRPKTSSSAGVASATTRHNSSKSTGSNRD